MPGGAPWAGSMLSLMYAPSVTLNVSLTNYWFMTTQEAGADPSLATVDSHTPLTVASENGHPEVHAVHCYTATGALLHNVVRFFLLIIERWQSAEIWL